MTPGVRSGCEVFVMFRDIIPVDDLGEDDGLERGRGRQGLHPDFRLEWPSVIRLQICRAMNLWCSQEVVPT